MPKVLIIIVNYNSSEYIGDCLSSVFANAYPTNDFEVLVVDNASTDNSVALIEQKWPAVVLIKNESNTGFAAANNQGINYAIQHNYDFVYLLNQDTSVEPAFLTEAVQLAMSDSRFAAVQSKLLLDPERTLLNSSGNHIHYLGFGFAGGYRQPDGPLKVAPIAYPSGAAVLLRLAALKIIGLFNEDFFMYHEDLDLGWRLWLAGYQVVLCPTSVVYHKYEFSRSIKKFYYMERNRQLVLLQNYRLATLLLIVPALIVMDFGLLVYALLRGGWWKEYFLACLYISNPLHWGKIWRTRRQVQKTRRKSDREITKLFSSKIEFQEINNPILDRVVNPLLKLYWRLMRWIIVW